MPLTISDNVRAPPVPLAYRIVTVLLPAEAPLIAKLAVAVPLFASVKPPTKPDPV